MPRVPRLIEYEPRALSEMRCCAGWQVPSLGAKLERIQFVAMGARLRSWWGLLIPQFYKIGFCGIC